MCEHAPSDMFMRGGHAMTTRDWQQGFSAAVEAARSSTVRVHRQRGWSTSGTVVAEDLVVTSQHALRNADDASIVDDQGAERSAQLVGTDAGSDIALLRVEGGGLTPPRFAAHDGLQVGQFALALGRPGKAIRASLRIIGLLSDEVQTPSGGRIERYIESDRGLPPGFRGGPLVDVEGQVIGMNTDALLRGCDLALPHATVSRVVAELVAHGRMRRAYLGVATQPLRLPAALRETLKQRSGALVVDLADNGPARDAGIRFGDVIVALDSIQVRGPRELAAALADRVGANVSVQYVRGGQVESVQLTLAERA
jgi:S1-C subfamily serine protease